MRTPLTICQATAALLVAGIACAPNAHSTGEGWGLNGSYLATSNGDWAQTNEIYHDEATIRSTWTITTTCTSPVDCTGRVISDRGWSADINYAGSEYFVKHDIPNWEPCANGTSRVGHQIYRFYPVDDRGFVSVGANVFAGQDKTSGDSGACSINKALVIAMPFRLEKAP